MLWKLLLGFLGVSGSSLVKPIVHISGPNPFKTGVSFTQDFDDEGADCSDHEPFDADLNAEVAVGGDVVDLQKAGTYVIKYYCDNDKGETTAARTVFVDQKYAPGCSHISVKGSRTGDADGTYELLHETHDGAPLFAQIDGSRKNHMYYFEESRTSEKFWAIEPYSLKQIRSSHWAVNRHSGLRVVSQASRPEDVKDVWTEYNSASKTFKLNYGVGVRCASNATLPAAAAPHYTVNFDVELIGYAASKFGELEQYDMIVALANALDVPVSDITIIRYLDTTSNRASNGFSGHRRLIRMASKGETILLIKFAVQTADEQVEDDMVGKLNDDAFEEGLFAESKDQGLHIARLYVDKSSITMIQPGQGAPKAMLLAILGMLATATLLVSMESYCTLKDQVEIELKSTMEEKQPLASTSD